MQSSCLEFIPTVGLKISAIDLPPGHDPAYFESLTAFRLMMCK